MQIDLTGKTAIVTGSTDGIGFATAKGLALAGARVVVTGRHQDTVDAAIAAIDTADRDVDVVGLAVDLATPEGCAELVRAHPVADILVNNVGAYGPKNFFELDDDDWRDIFELNVMSGVRLSRGYLPRMIDSGWGRVVFLSSESALNIPADMIHYGFSKTAVLAIARGLAKRVAGTGVTVNSVLPGPTLTDGVAEMLAPEVEKSGKSLDEVATAFVKRERPTSLIQRAASPEEVANLIVYTCSMQASATTGAALRVDGGVVDSIV